jgi:hypothetical protein
LRGSRLRRSRLEFAIAYSSTLTRFKADSGHGSCTFKCTGQVCSSRCSRASPGPRCRCEELGAVGSGSCAAGDPDALASCAHTLPAVPSRFHADNGRDSCIARSLVGFAARAAVGPRLAVVSLWGKYNGGGSGRRLETARLLPRVCALIPAARAGSRAHTHTVALLNVEPLGSIVCGRCTQDHPAIGSIICGRCTQDCFVISR